FDVVPVLHHGSAGAVRTISLVGCPAWAANLGHSPHLYSAQVETPFESLPNRLGKRTAHHPPHVVTSIKCCRWRGVDHFDHWPVSDAQGDLVIADYLEPAGCFKAPVKHYLRAHRETC